MSCPDLPPELILDILCRLPVKSLCRFRCVSKSWFSLINHPSFAKLHLSKTQRQRLIVPAESRSGLDLFSVDLENVSSNDDKVSTLELDFTGSSSSASNFDRKQVWLVASCNGLLCFCIDDDDDLFLCNPSANKCKKIRDFRFDYRVTKLRGFGYAEAIDDYKLVKIDDPGESVEVYSLREDSWKSIQIDLNVDFPRWCSPQGVPLNGAIHWVLSIENQDVIASFDLIDEKFETSLLPDIKTDNYSLYFLVVLRDCLCLSFSCMDTNQLWVMKDYNDKASWTRILTVEFPFNLQPFSCLADGKTLLFGGYSGTLVICNSEDGKLNIIDVDGMSEYSFDKYLYVESLVSPNYRADNATEGSLLEYLLE